MYMEAGLPFFPYCFFYYYAPRRVAAERQPAAAVGPSALSHQQPPLFLYLNVLFVRCNLASLVKIVAVFHTERGGMCAAISTAREQKKSRKK